MRRIACLVSRGTEVLPPTGGVREGPPNGLIHPVPDGAAADVIAGLYGLPEVNEVAAGITHGVGIFADVEGILGTFAALGCELHPANGRILIGAHIHDVVVALVLHRA